MQHKNYTRGSYKFARSDDETIPIAFFEQPVETVQDDDCFPIVYFDAEILETGASTCMLQLGASATVSNKSFSFFKYIQPDFLQGNNMDKMISDSKYELMDILRLKTSKFDITHSGKLNLYFKHPELGNVKSEGVKILEPHPFEKLFPLLQLGINEKNMKSLCPRHSLSS